MAVFTVQRVLQSQGGSAVPGDAFVYIRQAQANAGIFRTDSAGGSVARLNGGAWTPVTGGLSVDTALSYLAFWASQSTAANLPTAVLQHALEPAPRNPYSFTPGPDDLRANRIRIAQYQPVTVRAVDVEGPLYFAPGSEQTPQGGPAGGPTNFWWKTRWETSATSGYIVQEVATHLSGPACNGSPQPTLSPIYWEAWQVTGPNQFSPNAFDYWTINTGVGFRGTWIKMGRVYWVPALLPQWHFTPGGAPAASQLLSTLQQPQHLGTPLLVRRAAGQWNGCGGHPALFTHTRN